jgi:hypothetical protein
MIIKFDKFLNESPDTCYYDGGELNYRTSYAFPFGFYKGKCYIGTFNTTHYEIFDNYDKPRITRQNFENPGRIWSEQKIISFWSINHVNSLKKIVDDLNNEINNKYPEYNITIDETWKIEVYYRKAYYRVEFYNLFDFMKICPFGYNSNWVVSADDAYKNKYIDEDKPDAVNIRNFLPSNAEYLDNLYNKKLNKFS